MALEAGTPNEPFSTDTTIVATGLRFSQGEDILQKAKDFVKEALKLEDVTVVNALRTPFRDNKPGIVKIEFQTKEEKIQALKAKQQLKGTEDYKRVYF